MKKRKTQIDFLNEAIALSQKSPQAQIYFMADQVEQFDDVMRFEKQQIFKVEKALYYCPNETIYTDECTIKDDITERLCNETFVDDEFEEAVDRIFSKEANEAILIYTSS